MATLGLLKVKVLWRKSYDYDVINSAHDVTNTVLSRDSNHIVDAVMWLKSANSSISMRQVIITPIS